MKELVDKISSYNLFNYLFPGIIFVLLLNATTSYNLIQENIVEGAFLYYFIGLLINRVGSLVFEPVLKFIKFIKFKPPNEYRQAKGLYPKIEIYSEVNNMFRGVSAMLLVLIVFVVLEKTGIYIDFSKGSIQIVSLLLLFVMMLFAYRKQTKIIVDRVGNVLEEQKNKQ